MAKNCTHPQEMKPAGKNHYLSIVNPMRKLLLYFFLSLPFLLVQSACSNSGRTTKVVKPKYHHWRYERKNDLRVKRTKVVKMKS